MSSIAVTWWGHSSVTVELGSLRLGTDPVLSDRLAHLRRQAPSPTDVATELDVVLVSHLHGDHLHAPSLARISPEAPVLVPRGAKPLLKGLSGRHVREVEPGDRLTIAEAEIEVLPAHHDGRRHPWSKVSGPALGFRVEAQGGSFWYPGDTGEDPRAADVDPVDLALVPIGGWGPTLGDEHLGPEQAAHAVALVGARWAVPVHYGTFWPAGLRTLLPANHRRLFQTPAQRFVEALDAAVAVVPPHGERAVLDG